MGAKKIVDEIINLFLEMFKITFFLETYPLFQSKYFMKKKFKKSVHFWKGKGSYISLIRKSPRLPEKKCRMCKIFWNKFFRYLELFWWTKFCLQNFKTKFCSSEKFQESEEYFYKSLKIVHIINFFQFFFFK